MSPFNVTLRTLLETARLETASAHMCGKGDESHAWNPPDVDIVGPSGTVRRIVLFVMVRFKRVVVSATEIPGVGGAVGMTIVSLIASGRNSYIAPGTFAWTNVAPSRVAENRGCDAANWYGQSALCWLSEMSGRLKRSHRWEAGRW